MKLVWMPEGPKGPNRRYCLFLIKEDGVKIKIKDPNDGAEVWLNIVKTSSN